MCRLVKRICKANQIRIKKKHMFKLNNGSRISLPLVAIETKNPAINPISVHFIVVKPRYLITFKNKQNFLMF